MKKTLSLILALTLVMALLAGCTGAPAETSAPPSTTEAAPAKVVAEEARGVTIPPFSIKVNGVTVTNETMVAYPAYSMQTFSINSSGTESTCNYIGFAISDVLAAVGITDGYTKVEAIADDGYAIEYTAEQAASPVTLLAVTRDGEQFKSGPWFAPGDSQTSGDYLKGLAEIKVDADVTVVPDVSETTAPAETGNENTLPEISDKTDKVTFQDYAFKVNGQEVTNATLEGLHIYKITVTTINSKGNENENTYTGYRLSDVLTACGITEYSKVTAVANDGYENELNLESAKSEYCLVAIEKDKEVGEDGTIWVAPCDQTESKSYAKLVVEIKAE